MKNYDAIIVGARCAGSPTAMLLARRGYKVLVVDKAAFPSDTKYWGGAPFIQSYIFSATQIEIC